jgi:SAM-dependent methyltransferase
MTVLVVQLPKLAATICAVLPAAIRPTTVFPSWPLDHLARLLDLSPGQRFADIGCGTGSITRWIARTTQTSAIGIEPSAVGRRVAIEQSSNNDPVRFLAGHFTDTGLPDEAVHGVLSIDAIMMAPDAVAAFVEMARIIQVGGRLVVVGPVLAGQPPLSVSARAAGWEEVEATETPEWAAQMESFRRKLVAMRAAIAAEDGPDAPDNYEANIASAIARTTWHGTLTARRDR